MSPFVYRLSVGLERGWTVAGLVCLLASCRDPQFLDAQTGNEGAACHADGTCNDSLSCVGDVCVPAPDAAPLPDAMALADAAPEAPDAAVSATDAAVEAPDAAVSVADAAVEAPDAAVSAADAATSSDAGGIVLLVDCAEPGSEPSGGDFISRGFYVGSYPGSSLARVTIGLAASSPGAFRMRLTARAGTYDGPVLGVAEVDVSLTSTMAATSFDFSATSIMSGSTVTFVVDKMSGPFGSVSVATGPLAGSVCAVTETNGTSPPLDTFRRAGLWIRIWGG